MPTYEYLCDACAHRFDEFQSIKAAPLKKCPSCGKSKLKRLIGTGAGIIFKGSGFYETDYRSASYKAAAKADASAPAGSTTSSTASASTPASTSNTPAKSDSATASHSAPAKKSK